MNVLRGFLYRFYPTAEQETLLRRTLGCVRLVYNKALHERSEAWTGAKKSISYAAQSRALTEWKKTADLAFLNEVSSVPLQQALRHLQSAYLAFFSKRTRYPSFKCKSRGGSAEFSRSAFRFEDGVLTLAKMGEPLDVRWSRPLPAGAQPSTVTVSLDAAGRWHVSAGLAVARDGEVCGSDVSQRILRNAVRSELKQKNSRAISGIPSL